MKFLADVHVPRTFCQWLRDSGHDVFRLVEHRLERLIDADIVTLAAGQDRVILTADRGISRYMAAGRSAKPSVVVFRTPDDRPETWIDLLARHLPHISDALTRGAIVVLSPAGRRIRLLPIF